jgi:mono/diheme cytochrome c family protein
VSYYPAVGAMQIAVKGSTMTRRRAHPFVFALLALGVLLLAVETFAQSPTSRATDKPPAPFAPQWAQFAGFEVFAKKDCGKCHAVRGAGGTGGPDLARVAGDKSFFGIGASLWNHVPWMGSKMRAQRMDRPRLTALEASNLIAFLFTAQYGEESGNAANGAKLFADKTCASCHTAGGKGGRMGPDLDHMKRANSPVSVAAAMWNHGPTMAAAMVDQQAPRPMLETQELLDIVAHIRSVSRDTGETEQVIPGTPERGRKLFAEKKCATCHAVGGKGPRVGPDLGTAGHHVSLSDFATRMWNHQGAMIEKMKARRIALPELTGQDMADVLSYLYVSRYFDPVGSAERGRALAKDKGCLTCHTAGSGKGKHGAGDFARSNAVKTAGGLVAGMWNHSLRMEQATAQQSVEWPILTAQDMADLSAFFGRLKPAPAK